MRGSTSSQSMKEGFSLVPKFCLGTQVGKLCFASCPGLTCEAEPRNHAFPSRAWERGGCLTGTVHGGSVDKSAGVGRGGGEQGWQRTVPRLGVRGAAVAECQIRGGVSAPLRGNAAVGERAGAVLCLLQRGPSASVAGLPNASGGLWGGSAVGGIGKHSFSPRTTSAGVKAVRREKGEKKSAMLELDNPGFTDG
jgi:hypothetical protein